MRTFLTAFVLFVSIFLTAVPSQALPATTTPEAVQVAPDQYEIPVHITGSTVDQLMQGRQIAANFEEKHPELKIRHWDPKLKDPGKILGPGNPTVAIIIQL